MGLVGTQPTSHSITIHLVLSGWPFAPLRRRPAPSKRILRLGCATFPSFVLSLNYGARGINIFSWLFKFKTIVAAASCWLQLSLSLMLNDAGFLFPPFSVPFFHFSFAFHCIASLSPSRNSVAPSFDPFFRLLWEIMRPASYIPGDKAPPNFYPWISIISPHSLAPLSFFPPFCGL